MLEELNLGQRTKYLAQVTNPNKDWPVFVYGEDGSEFKLYSEVFEDKSHHGKSESKSSEEKPAESKESAEKKQESKA